MLRHPLTGFSQHSLMCLAAADCTDLIVLSNSPRESSWKRRHEWKWQDYIWTHSICHKPQYKVEYCFNSVWYYWIHPAAVLNKKNIDLELENPWHWTSVKCNMEECFLQAQLKKRCLQTSVDVCRYIFVQYFHMNKLHSDNAQPLKSHLPSA